MPVRAAASRFPREIALLASGVLLASLGVAAHPVEPVAPARTTLVAAEQPAVRAVSAAATRNRPAVPAAPAPAPTVAPRHVAARPAARPVPRWLPTGTGMWIHDWNHTEDGDAKAVVARAKAAGLTHLYVQTGSSKKGWIGNPVLSRLLPATSGTGIKVVAWDFPKLDHPEADARRLAKAAWYRAPGAPRVAAVAPDVETASEGTHATKASIDRYYRALRKHLPRNVAIVSTVPWPSEKRIHRYPYVQTSRYADAFAPMAYWYNRSPAQVTATSMAVLRRYGKPVFPVGQGYDGRIDAPYLAPDPAPGKSVDAFVHAARRAGAASLSLWSWQTTGGQQWGALRRASAAYRPVLRQPAPASAVPSPTLAPTAVPQPG